MPLSRASPYALSLHVPERNQLTRGHSLAWFKRAVRGATEPAQIERLKQFADDITIRFSIRSELNKYFYNLNPQKLTGALPSAIRDLKVYTIQQVSDESCAICMDDYTKQNKAMEFS